MHYPNYKHSASSGNKWLDSMSAWIWSYGFRNWGKDNPRANMGKAAEQAVFATVSQGRTPEWAEEHALMIFDKMHEGEVHEERESVGPIAANMARTLLDLGGKFERRPKEVTRMQGLDLIVTHEADLFHDIGTIDLKATLKMPWGEGKPKAPRASHLRQMGLYADVYNCPSHLLYATAKRVELFRVPDEDALAGAQELYSAFAQIERWANQFPTPEQAVRFIPLNTDTFYWDDEEAVLAARKLWREHSPIAA